MIPQPQMRSSSSSSEHLPCRCVDLVEFGDYARSVKRMGPAGGLPGGSVRKYGLEPPTSYATLKKAVEFLRSSASGFVAATDPSQEYMVQLFRHIAMANGVDVVDGRATLPSTPLRETLEFISSLLITATGEPLLAAVRELYPTPGRRDHLVALHPSWSGRINDGVPVTGFGGSDGGQALEALRLLDIIRDGLRPSGAGWAGSLWASPSIRTPKPQSSSSTRWRACMRTLGMAAVGKHPVRSGTVKEPTSSSMGRSRLEVGQDRWKPISEIYSSEVIKDMLGLGAGLPGIQKGTHADLQNL